MSYERSAERSAVVENADCYENLANAIILQAVKDYKKALHRLDGNPRNRDALHDKVRLERFFHSAWYGILTDLDSIPSGKEKGKDSEHADDSETKSTGERSTGAGSMTRIPHWMRHLVLSGGDFFVLCGIVLSKLLLCAEFCYMVRVQKYT